MTDIEKCNERLDLIRLMMLEAGRIMEETGSTLALTYPDNRTARDERLQLLRSASDEISALAHAADALNRRPNFPD